MQITDCRPGAKCRLGSITSPYTNMRGIFLITFLTVEIWGGMGGDRTGPDHVSLKIKHSFQVHSSSSSLTTFYMMSTKSQLFMTVKTHGSCFTGNNLWQITARGCLANKASQERAQPFHISRQINIAIHSPQKYPVSPCCENLWVHQ